MSTEVITLKLCDEAGHEFGLVAELDLETRRYVKYYFVGELPSCMVMDDGYVREVIAYALLEGPQDVGTELRFTLGKFDGEIEFNWDDDLVDGSPIGTISSHVITIADVTREREIS